MQHKTLFFATSYTFKYNITGVHHCRKMSTFICTFTVRYYCVDLFQSVNPFYFGESTFLQSVEVCKVCIFGLFLLHFEMVLQGKTIQDPMRWQFSLFCQKSLQYWTVPEDMWMISCHPTFPPTQSQYWDFIKPWNYQRSTDKSHWYLSYFTPNLLQLLGKNTCRSTEFLACFCLSVSSFHHICLTKTSSPNRIHTTTQIRPAAGPLGAHRHIEIGLLL